MVWFSPSVACVEVCQETKRKEPDGKASVPGGDLGFHFLEAFGLQRVFSSQQGAAGAGVLVGRMEEEEAWRTCEGGSRSRRSRELSVAEARGGRARTV